MLVFSRKKNEWIDLGNDIEICVVEIRGDKVRLGINAPRSLAVHRREVSEKIKASNEPTVLLCQPQDVESAKKLLEAQRNEPQ